MRFARQTRAQGPAQAQPFGMANYSGAARTNYFTVKDETAFRTWAAKHRLEVIVGQGGLGLLPGDTDDGCFPNYALDEDDLPFDIADEVAAHLADGSIAVVMEAGHEKSRYMSGWATAIDSRGERVSLNLDGIYERAEATFGIRPSDASY